MTVASEGMAHPKAFHEISNHTVSWIVFGIDLYWSRGRPTGSTADMFDVDTGNQILADQRPIIVLLSCDVQT